MAKRYIRLNFQNSPSTATPLNMTNINKMDKGIDDCDNAIEDLYSVKFAKTDIVQTDTVNDITKIASAAVTRALGLEIDAVNNNLAVLSGAASVSDANVCTPNKYQVMQWNGSTLNTPYKEGLTAAATGMILSFSTGSYGVQLSLASTSKAIYMRTLSAGTWSAWSDDLSKKSITLTTLAAVTTNNRLLCSRKVSSVFASGNLVITYAGSLTNILSGFTAPSSTIDFPCMVYSGTTAYAARGLVGIDGTLQIQVPALTSSTSVTLIFNFSYDL